MILHTMKISKILLLMVVIFYLQGCAVFPKNQVKPYNDFSHINKSWEKPVIFLDYKRFWSEPGKSSLGNRTVAISQLEHQYITKIVESSGLFSKVIFENYLKEEADYTIEIYLYNYNRNPGLILLGTLLSGFSIGIIPTSITQDYILKARVIDKTGNAIDEYTNQDAITTWLGILVIPFGSKVFNENPTVTNMVNDLLRHFVEDENSGFMRMTEKLD